ncbi:DUF664 domain-containing protein, partial [Streptomyces roseus]
MAGWSPVGRRSARVDRRLANPACRRAESSNLSLLGLVRHLAGVEQCWFRHVTAGEDARRHYRTAADPRRISRGRWPTRRRSRTRGP